VPQMAHIPSYTKNQLTRGVSRWTHSFFFFGKVRRLAAYGSTMTLTLRILSLAAIILGVFWSVYAVANGFRAIDGDPSYFIPQAAQFLFWGISG
jgi:hypothetical protein